MIRPNKKIGIIYSGNSQNYAKELKKIIIDYRTNGYCIEPIMVDSSLLDQEQDIELRVFNNLSKCDYAFVFLLRTYTLRVIKYFYQNLMLYWNWDI